MELRQYTLLPGRRDELVELFEAHFTEAQEHCGITMIGTFRDLADPQRFVWLRGFPNMIQRKEALHAFYGGPVWREHRDAANSTMVDSDNVLLLRPATEDGALRRFQISAASGCNVVHAGIIGLDERAADDDVAYFRDEVTPLIEATGSRVLACLVTEPATNTFPALPVREDDTVLVWFAESGHVPDSGAAVEAGRELAEATQRWPGAISIETLTLSPTPSFRLERAVH